VRRATQHLKRARSLNWTVGSLHPKENQTMANKITGTFSGKIRTQTAANLFHEDNHALTLIEVAGMQKSADPLWNGARITYCGTSDLLNGNGPQKGYWYNEHVDGDRDWGTFEGRIVTSGQQVAMEGTFKFTGGTGKFMGISGTGTYRGNFPSATDVVNEWQGEYTLASAAKAAR
jgi:hypothetical protein